MKSLPVTATETRPKSYLLIHSPETLLRCPIRMNSPAPSPKFAGFITLTLFVALIGLILGVAQGFFGYPFRKIISLDSTQFAPAEGFAYLVPLPLEYSPRGAQSSSAKLYEDANISQFYSHRADSVSKVGKGIFSFARGGSFGHGPGNF